MKKTKNLGDFSEKIAKNFLEKRGYKTLKKNVVLGHKEIDLIMQYGQLTIFVEVKSRTSKPLKQVATPLNSKQFQTLKKAISQYCAQNKINQNLIRLDLITVDINNISSTAKIKHYKDLF